VRKDNQYGFWATAIRLTAIGWMLALPIAVGAILGKWLDNRFHQGSLWTVTLIFAGLVVGVYSVYVTIREEWEGKDRR
jgi:ATP synthase protein I